MTHPSSHDLFNGPNGTANVRFISAKVQADAAAVEFSKAADEFFNTSVKLLLLAQNVEITQQTGEKLKAELNTARRLCDELCLYCTVSKAVKSGSNLFRYLRYLLEKVEDHPAIDTYYEIASVAEVLAEGIVPKRASSL